jgi:transcriptional regulator with XRE-family HTH domain
VKTLRELRKARGLTASQAAEQLGVWVVTIYNWESERNVPKEVYQQRLAEFYGVPVDEIYFPPFRPTGPKRNGASGD